MENESASKPTKQDISETIAQDCQSDTNSGFLVESEDIPDSLGRYEIERLLGRGGMGSVYLARDTNLRREVALKVPKFSSETNPQLIERFYREARSAANLSHPNLCPVFDVGEIDGTHYIAMAHIKGKPLSHYVQSEKPPEPRVAATIVRKVALAMEDAHKSGILHRDLKPANIMIDHRKEPIVMDFGLACPQDNGDESRLTREGVLLGSPAYMPPEQLTGKTEVIGPTSDVYSLGVVLYELLTGRLPFDGVESTIALIGRILSEVPKDILDVRSGIDKALANICRKAMAKDTAQRYPSMKAFASDLARYLRTQGKDKTIALAEPKAGPDAKTIRLEEQTKLVRTLCKKGQLEAASQILDQIVADPNAKNSETGVWAAAMIPKVKSQMTKQMQVAKTRSEASTTPSSASAPIDDPFANLPTPVTTQTNSAPGSVASPYTRPQRARSSSSKTSQNNQKLIFAGGAAVAFLGFVGIGSFLWYQRSSPPTDTSSSISSPASDTDEIHSSNASTPPTQESGGVDADRPIRRERGGRREYGSPEANDRMSPEERREAILHPEELLSFDEDGDGKVALSQLSDAQRRIFRFADVNDDGFLDTTEIEEMQRRRPRPPQGFDDRPGPPGDRPFPRGGPPKGPRGREPFEPSF